jgi:hypothetical protein
VRVEDGESGREIWARVTEAGEDFVIVVGGGDRPHVGCVVLALPIQSKNRPGAWSACCSVLTLPPHKEEPIARGIASRITEALGRVTVVTAGVHEDDLDQDGVAVYLRLGEELAEVLVEHLVKKKRTG